MSPSSKAFHSDPTALLKPFALYSLGAIAAILILMGGGAYYLHRETVAESLLEHSVELALAIAEEETAHIHQPDGRLQITAATAQRLRHYLLGYGSYRLVFFDQHSQPLFSLDRANGIQYDSVTHVGDEVAEVLATRQVVKEWKVASGEQGTARQLIEIYVPLYGAGETHPLGVMELYLDVSRQAGGARAFLMLTILLLMLILAANFISQYYLMRRSTQQLRAAHQVISHLAQTDGLTGLFNRNEMLRRIEALQNAWREEPGLYRSLAVIMLDLDHFKQINDRYGHIAGDRVLCAVARLLQQQVREGDILARFGGEEFTLVLPGVCDGAARERAAQILEALRDCVVDLEPSGDRLQLTASLGLALQHDPQLDFGHLIAEADRALYRAKDKGRNRLELATDFG